MEFYLSYAEKEMSILEPLCGSGRFLIPFLEKGYQIKGVDNSREMLEKLKQKAPDSMVEQSDIEKYQTQESFDYKQDEDPVKKRRKICFRSRYDGKPLPRYR